MPRILNRLSLLSGWTAIVLLTAAGWSRAEEVSLRHADREFETMGFSVDAGFVFFDGRAVDPPYVFDTWQGQVSLNGRPLDFENLRHPASEEEWNDETESRFGRRRLRPTEARPTEARPTEARPVGPVLRALAEDLEAGACVAFFPKQPPAIFRQNTAAYELLLVLSDPNGNRSSAAERPAWLPSEIGPLQWEQWMSTFRPTPAFLNRAAGEIARVEANVALNQSSIAAVRRLEVSAYPMTLFGMGLVVIAFGHLLSHRPSDMDQSGPLVDRLVRRSLLLIVVLSALDLVWTLLTSQANSMREINPLGSQLIDRPEQLVLFKLTATGIAVGLLFFLRQSALARRVTWWSCLVLTLLIARWVTFNSMFVS